MMRNALTGVNGGRMLQRVGATMFGGGRPVARTAAIFFTILTLTSARHSEFVASGTTGFAGPSRGGRVLAQQETDANLLSGLPLEVLATTPAALLEPPTSGEINLRGAEAIQVVYSRPVIAIGSDFDAKFATTQVPFQITGAGANGTVGIQDVPFGRFRWVTTYIARFDPIDGAWPTDLDLEFQWNRQLTTWDGVALTGGETLQDFTVLTPPLKAKLSGVRSADASNATGGAWDPRWARGPPEVPSDGIIVVSFTGSSVDTTLVQEAVTVQTVDGVAAPGAVVAPAPECDENAFSTDARTYVCFTVEAILPATTYQLVLPAGTRYNTLSGALTQSIKVKFSSLRPFTTPLKAPPVAGTLAETKEVGARHRRLELYMPHGLSSGTSAKDIAARLKLEELAPPWAPSSPPSPVNVPISVEVVSAAFVHVLADLVPARKYALALLPPPPASVKGSELLSSQPLVTKAANVADSVVFTMQQLPERVSQADFFPPELYIDAQSLTNTSSWRVFTSGLLPPTVTAYNHLAVPVTFGSGPPGGLPLANLLDEIVDGGYYDYPQSAEETDWAALYPATHVTSLLSSFAKAKSPPYFGAVDFPLDELLGETGMALLSFARQPQSKRGTAPGDLFLTAADFSVALLTSGSRIFIWATDLASGEPVVEVEIMARLSDASSGKALYKVDSSTDGFGLAELQITQQDLSASGVGTFPVNFGTSLTVTATRPGPGTPGVSPVVVLNNVFFSFDTPGNTSKASLIVDRRVVAPGQQLNIGGRIRDVGNGATNVTALPTVALRLCGSKACLPAPLKAKVDPTFGSYLSTITLDDAAVAVLGLGAAVLQVRKPGAVGAPSPTATAPTATAGPAAVVRRRLARSAPPPPPPFIGDAYISDAPYGAAYGPGPSDYGAADSYSAYPESNDYYGGVDSYGSGVPSIYSGDYYSATTYDDVLAYVDIVIADPRPPTAELSLGAPATAPPSATITVSGNATSLIGGDVSGGAVTIAWTIQRVTLKGKLTAEIGPDGAFSAVLDLAAQAPNAGIGAEVLFSAEWVGPTRERLQGGALTSIQYSEYSVAVGTSVSEPLPGLPFAITVDVDGPEPATLVVTVYTVQLTRAACDDLDGCFPEVFDAPLRGRLSPAVSSNPQENIVLSPAQQSQLIGSAPAVCTLSVDAAASWDGCRWELPGLGRYALIGCASPVATTPLDAPARACTVALRGLPLVAWQASRFSGPLPAAARWKVPEGASGFKPGSNATLMVENPAEGASLTVFWLNIGGAHQEGHLPAGFSLLDVPVPAACAGGCAASYALSWPRLPMSPLAPVLPLNPGYDAEAPHLAKLDDFNSAFPIAEDREVVEVTVTVNGGGAVAPVAAPFSNVTVELTVLECSGGACRSPRGDVELIVYAVDQAWLTLRPSPLLDEAAFFEVPVTDYSTLTGIFTSFATGKYLDAWAKYHAALRDADPWIYSDYYDMSYPVDDVLKGRFQSMHPSLAYGAAYYGEYYDGEYYSGSEYARGAPLAAEAPATSTQSQGSSTARDTAGAGAGGAQAEGGPSVRVTNPLDVTPFFQRVILPAASNGSTTVTFMAPGTLSTYVVRAYAAAATGVAYGAAEAEVIVRKPLSLTPSVPRLLRVGDNATAGVVVTGFPPALAPLSVDVSVAVSGAAVPVGPSSASVMLTAASGTAEVRFALTAVALGPVTITFKAVAQGGPSDALETAIESMVTQAPVTLASSFAIDGGNATGWVEGLSLPKAAPGTGTVSVTAGVGRLPAQLAMIEPLLGAMPARASDATAAWALQVNAAYGALRAYGDPPFAATVTVRAGAGAGGTRNETVCAGLTAAMDMALAALVPLTAIERVGLMRYPEGAWPGWVPPRKADARLNLEGRFSAFLALGTILQTPEPACNLDGGLEAFYLNSTVWEAVGASQVLADALESRRSAPGSSGPAYSDLFTLALLWLLKTPAWDPSSLLTQTLCAARHGVPAHAAGTAQTDCTLKPKEVALKAVLADDVSIERLVDGAAALPLDAAALLALALGPSGSIAANVTAALDTLDEARSDALRITARTAYAAAAPSSAAPAPPATQALVMLAGLEVTPPAILEKLANYLAASQGGGALFYQPSFGAAYTMAALATYDTFTGSTVPNLQVLARSQPVTLLDADFAPGGALVVTGSASWGELAVPPAPLEFLAEGTGQASIAALLTFVPASLPAAPVYQGLYVALAVRQTAAEERAAPVGPPLSVAPLASVLAVTVQVTTPDALADATLQVLMPAGLEPLDPELDAAAARRGCAQPWYLSGAPFGASWLPPCPQVATAPSNVTFHVGALAAGAHEFSLLAVAASPGTFTFPPAVAFADGEGEVTGLSAGGLFTVCASTTCTEAELASAAPTNPPLEALPVACPGSCNGAGSCDTARGVCECAAPFTGPACAMVTDL